LNTKGYSAKDLNNLKNKIDSARKKYEQIWNNRGQTDLAVLAAGEEVDLLLNEYRRLTGKHAPDIFHFS